jgi:hypothetical protein
MLCLGTLFGVTDHAIWSLSLGLILFRWVTFSGSLSLGLFHWVSHVFWHMVSLVVSCIVSGNVSLTRQWSRCNVCGFLCKNIVGRLDLLNCVPIVTATALESKAKESVDVLLPRCS